MLHTYWYRDKTLHQNIPVEDWRGILESEEGFFWVDMEDPTENEIDHLSDVFDFHPLAIEDAIFPQHRPKVDEYESYLYIIFHAVVVRDTIARADNLDILELNIFLGSNYVVTFHEDHLPHVAQIRSRCAMQAGFLSRGPGYLVHAIMDTIVDEMTRLITRMDDRLDAVEDKILTDEEGSLNELSELKELVARFRKAAAPQRDVVRLLATKHYPQIPESQLIYFSDVLDHLMIIMDTTSHFREMISSTFDTYLSMVSKKMNNVMRVLTVVTTIFLPLQLIASIYGMNFHNMPELDYTYGYHWVLFLMALVAVVMVLIFKRLKWF